jgi:ribosome-associated protein
MRDGLHLGAGIFVPIDEIELRASRSGGPGGQHANKTASRIEAVFDVLASPSLTEAQKERVVHRLGPRVTAVAQDARSQTRNRGIALERLRARLAEALTPRKHRRPTQPGRGARERRLQAKRQRAERKQTRKRPTEEY